MLSWNISYGQDVKTVARVINSQKPRPDIVCLQEVGGGNTRVDGLAVAAQLQGLTGYPFMWYSEEFRELRYGSDSKIGTGQTIISKYLIEQPKKLVFKNQIRDWSPPKLTDPLTWLRFRGYAQPRSGGRLAQIATIQVAGQELTIINAHLESKELYKPRLREKQIGEALNGSKNSPMKIIAGDLNSGPESQVITKLRQNGYVEWMESTSTGRPTTQDGFAYDWVFFKSSNQKISARRGLGNILNNVATSDHYPLLATFVVSP